MAVKVLLDSTYLLPSFGVEVEELPRSCLAKLRDLALKGAIEIYCSAISWVEVIGKVCREVERRRLNIKDVKDVVEVAIKSIFKTGFYKWVNLNEKAVKLAFELRVLGHKDNIDNLLYATAVVNDMVFLTMDEEFKMFLASKGFKTENVINHDQLFRMVGRG